MNKEKILAYLEFQENDIEDALNEIAKINKIMDDPTHQTLSETQRDAVVAGMALHLQSFYTGVELVLKNTLIKIDGIVPEGDAWHARLLKQAHRDTDYRSKIISDDTFENLDNLRGFRNVVRNLYGSALEPSRVMDMVEYARKASVSLDRDWKDFKKPYQSSPAAQPPTSRGPK